MPWHFVDMSMILSVPSIKSLQRKPNSNTPHAQQHQQVQQVSLQECMSRWHGTRHYCCKDASHYNNAGWGLLFVSAVAQLC